MRTIFLVMILLLLSEVAISQVSLGLKFAPTLSYGRIQLESDTEEAVSLGSGLRFIAGPTVDVALHENYIFHTGLYYVPRRVEMSIINTANNTRDESLFFLQYVQLPVGMKFYTNEVALDKKLYFHIGGNLEVLLNQKPAEEDFQTVVDFRPLDASIFFATGMEFRMGVNTRLYAGLGYQRGLFNTVSSSNVDQRLVIKNDLITIDFGIIF